MQIARTVAIVLLPVAIWSGTASSTDPGRAPLEPPQAHPRGHHQSARRIPETTVTASIIDEQMVAALTPKERSLLQWASDRFALVGLELPDVDVSFHDDARPCNGHEGIFHGDGVRPRLQVCVPDRGTSASDLWRQRTLIHELAHAWEHVNLDDADRSELLEVLDADRWFSNDLTWDERGGERFAETIVWGLYDQLRRPVLIDGSCQELHADFQYITGHTAPGPLAEVCTPRSSHQSVNPW